MRELHCPVCGNSFVRMTCHESSAERLLSHLNIFPFRCQLCTNRFRAFYAGGRYNTQAFDRREFTRLTTSIEAQIIDYKQPVVTNRVTDISMDGCTLQATGFPKGTFLEMVLKPTEEEQTIRIETAMVCSVRPSSMGVRFLEMPPEHYRRLAQVVLGLLVGQGLGHTLNA